MIRILHVFGSLNRGGAETMIMNLYRHIDRNRIQFDFVVHSNEKGAYEKEIEELGGKIFRVPRYNIKNHLIYTNIWEKFFSEYKEYKIIHGHLRGSAFQYLKVAKKMGLKTIMHSHSTSSRGEGIEKVVKNLLRYLMRRWIDYPCACSTEAGVWLFGKNIIKNPNFKIIKNGIETGKYKYSEERRRKMRKLLNLKDEVILGHVGSFTYPKNHKFLIDIFSEIQKKEKNSKLILVGDGELRGEINEKVKKLNLEDKVIFTGIVNNVEDYLQVMDVFVFPSYFEGLPVSVIEAQATGVKCVLSNTITKEVEIRKNLIFWENINTKVEKWADIIFRNLKYKRCIKNDFVIEKGYDVKKNALHLAKYYEEIIR